MSTTEPVASTSPSSADDHLLQLIHQHLEPLKQNKPQLRLLLENAAQLGATAQQLAQRTLKEYPHEEMASLQRAALLLLKHEIRLLLEEQGSLQQKTEHMLHFLEDDVHHCLTQAVEKGIEEKVCDAKQLAAFAQETNLDLHQMFSKTQKEITSPESTIEPAVRQALIAQIGKFDTEYSVSNIQRWLRNQLGISLIAAVEKRMTERSEELINAFKSQQHTDTERAELIAQLTKKIGSLQAKAEARVRKEFSNPQLQQLLITKIKEIADTLLEESAWFK